VGTKTIKTKIISNQNKNKVGLVLNLNHETKQIRIRMQHVWNKNPTKFYYKFFLKIEQGYNKKVTQNWCWTN
jgi:hypothetical protein